MIHAVHLQSYVYMSMISPPCLSIVRLFQLEEKEEWLRDIYMNLFVPSRGVALALALALINTNANAFCISIKNNTNALAFFNVSIN